MSNPMDSMERTEPMESNVMDEMPDQAVAVIGMAGRFPGASSVEEMWANQLAGKESITFFSPEELAADGVPPELAAQPGYVPARGVLDDVDLFDAELFGLPPREAEIMDPQLRLFLEICWSACENAGYAPGGFAGGLGGGRAGLFAGATASSYLVSHLFTRPDVAEQVGPLQIQIRNDKDHLTAWVAYKLGFEGPCVAVQTACSTSLTAVHLACQALLLDECDIALAGGTAVTVPRATGYLYQEGSILAPDGHCRAFDAAAAGSVPGSGVGAVVLARLDDALANGDPIRAVIRATALTNDGSRRVGYTAPGVDGQMRAIAEAISLAGVGAETVGFVETHGSGTALGDPIEVEALTRAFRRAGATGKSCALGSAKASLGHLDSAAGITGLIRAVCAVESGQIPPMANFERPNPALDLDTSPFYVPAEALEWPAGTAPRRAGVSSFGIGGVNVHAVIEQAPAHRPVPSEGRPWQLLLASAQSEASVDRAAENLATSLGSSSLETHDLADAAHTLHVGRHRFRHRRAAVCRDAADAAMVLRGDAAGRLRRGVAPRAEDAAGVAFLLPGLGDQYPGMTHELYAHEPAFRHAVDTCAELLEPHLELDIRTVLYPDGTNIPASGAAPGAGGLSLRRMVRPASSEENGPLDATYLAHPAVFTVEWALAQLFAEWGIRPRALIGYSLGEWTAACLAGVFPLAEALGLVADRARRIDALPPGAMLAVPLPEDEALPWIEADPALALAAANGASLSVAAGPPEAVDGLARRLDDGGIACRRMATRHAFHSPMMEPIREGFAARVAASSRQAPEIPFVSNSSGTWITAEEAVDPHYWAAHLVRTVRFSDGLDRLLAEDDLALLELGPGQALTTLARQHPACTRSHVVVPALPDRREEVSEQAHLLDAAGRLWTAGLELDGAGFYRHQSRRRVALPAYPFERRRYWIERGAAPAIGSGTAGAGGQSLSAALGKPADLADWLYLEGWRRAEPLAPSRGRANDGSWLVLADDAGLGQALADHLRTEGERVVVATAGASSLAPVEEGGVWSLDPSSSEGFRGLLRALEDDEESGGLPRRVIHLWTLGVPRDTRLDTLATRVEDGLERGYYSLVHLAQALGETELTESVEVTVVTDRLFDVTGAEQLDPLAAVALGPVRVIPQEYPQLRSRLVDLDLAMAGRNRVARDLATELRSTGMDDTEPAIALRGPHRWRRALETARLDVAPDVEGLPPRLRRGGVYLVTGGADETGCHMASHLARAAGARLALLVPEEQAAGETLGELAELLGERLLVLPADFTNADALDAALQAVKERFGALHGVVHAASVPGHGILQLKTREQAEPVLAPKVAGTLALHGALARAQAAGDLEELDFMMLFSSTLAEVGGLGLADFCAANTFVDAFARWSTRHDAAEGARVARWTLAVGWDAFHWERPDADVPENLLEYLAADLEQWGLGTDELATFFERLLGTRLAHATISARPLPELIAETAKPADVFDHLAGEEHQRPDLPTAYRAPESATEQTIARFWQAAFGIDRVGVDDNFFELEGSSLIALQLTAQLRKELDVDLPVASIFESPTVAELAERVETLREKAQNLAELDAMLAEIEGLSGAEAEVALSEGESTP